MEETSQLVRLQLPSGPALARPRCTCLTHPRERRMEREGEEGTQAARSLSKSSRTALEALGWDVLAYPFLSPPRKGTVREGVLVPWSQNIRMGCQGQRR